MEDLIKKIVEGTIDDMVFRDEPKKKHVKRMGKDLGPLSGFPIEKFKNVLPPKNESGETEEEIQKLDSISVDSDFVESADDVDNHFEKFLDSKDLEYPREEIKKYMSGVRAIILQLKYHYNRPRPGQVADAKGMNFDRESLKSASTPSYPSGHATQGRFISKLLSDMYPEYEDQLMKIGDDIAYSRNMAKVHYPSDSKFGKELGDELYDFISKSKLRESIKKALNEDEAPITLHTITSNHCNGYGDYSNYVNTYLGGNSLDGMYYHQTLTFPATMWDNGNSWPQVGEYHWYRGIVWKISHIGPDDGNSLGVPGGLHPANVGNGEWCSSHWTCNPIKPHLHCKKHAIHNQPGAYPNLVNEFGNEDACLHNCPDTPTITRDDVPRGTGVVTDPPNTQTTNCVSNIPGINCLKPLIIPPINVSQPVTQAGCCMTEFSFSNSPKPTFTIQGCKDSVSGNMGYELLRNGLLIISSTNNPGNAMTFNATLPGDYTGNVVCDNIYGIDTISICLEEDPNDPFVSDPTGNYVSGSFLEIPCTYRTPTSQTNDIQIGEERETLTNEDIESLVNKKLAPLSNLNLGDVSEEEEEIKEVKNKYGIDVAYSSRLNEKGTDKPPKKKRIKIKESTLERMITRLISESRLLLKIKTRR